MSIPDILTYLNVLKTSTLIRLVQLITYFVSLWLGAAGFLHLVSSSMSMRMGRVRGAENILIPILWEVGGIERAQQNFEHPG